MSETSVTIFRNALNKVDWDQVRCEDLDSYMRIFIEFINGLNRRCFQVRVKNLNKPKSNNLWIIPYLLKLIDSKAFYFRLFNLIMSRTKKMKDSVIKLTPSLKIIKATVIKTYSKRTLVM